ncbi:transcriptional regulator [Psychrobacter faecalis]|jgi:DNA-binding transcriptional regulator YdaS (Cro superfamily)|uniref:transcriptional regulator n=1 Tax=Psychrobacter faecalis TaxID=180588 RepID=UPI0018E05D13|nr:YdaS family helix-turn-helix protein [Psychrobacter faecalis]
MNLKPITPKQALAKAVKAAGGQTELANLINTKQQNVWQWLNRDGKASAKYVVKISEATGVPYHELRPDIFPTPAPANDPSNQQQLA